MTDNHARLKTVDNSFQVENLLDHLGWQSVVKPELMRRRNNYTATLVNAVLAGQLPDGITKEQIAGLIYGIDEIIKLFEKILENGAHALADLETQGFHIERS